MKRKIIPVLLLAAALALTVLAGCSSRDDNTSSGGSSSSSSSSSSMPSSSADTSSEEDNGTGPNFFGTADDKLTAAYDAAREAVGEAGFVLNPMDDTGRLEEAYGIDPELVDSAIIEIPMMSTHVGTFVGIKAKDGKGEEVEKALTAYRDKLAEDEMQYPMNAMKAKSGQVVREGDYVFFLLLGEVSDAAMDMEDADQLDYYRGENEKAAEAVRNAVK